MKSKRKHKHVVINDTDDMSARLHILKSDLDRLMICLFDCRSQIRSIEKRFNKTYSHPKTKQSNS